LEIRQHIRRIVMGLDGSAGRWQDFAGAVTNSCHGLNAFNMKRLCLCTAAAWQAAAGEN
jgi:hypothetical protein